MTSAHLPADRHRLRSAGASLRLRWIALAFCGGAMLAGVGAVWRPAATAAVAGGVLAATVALLSARELPRVFLNCVGLLLLGYAFLGKGVAYLGIPPVYVGEVVLACGIAAVVVGNGLTSALFRHPLSWLVLAFAAWGAARTVPFIPRYGIHALRDAAVWGYAAFALLVAAFLLRTSGWWRLFERYASWFRWYPFWIPLAWGAYRLAGDALPRAPGADVPLLLFKAGDAAVHMAGVAALVLLRLDPRPARRGRRPWTDWLWWGAWLLGFLGVASASRGGFAAVVAAGLVVLLFRPWSEWPKPASLAVAAMLVFALSGISIRISEERTISAAQFVENIRSVSGNTAHEGLAGTREWRLQWWRDIVDYTVFGDYFWTGKGYGVNLADDDGYQVNADGSLRSPHNGHLTILARGGVPGLSLWLVLQGAFAVALARAYFRARRAAHDHWARLNLWLLAYWTAFHVNGAFDVFLEGPQGGIWFWSMFGFAIAVLIVQKRELGSARAGPRRAAAAPTESTMAFPRAV